ncbi:hypothetical protein SY111_16630 [Ligilactobacillus agilis]|uniref:Uncharacterized protein n=1 Tax=Ligilactobacillus agilis TaxID=1601 RepID=A0A6F9XUV2_9LACO|nr:hypothetical protein SY111_16630 [Ligilactobacillus agilis]
MKIDKDYGLVSCSYELRIIADLNRKTSRKKRSKNLKRTHKRRYTREIELGCKR